MSLRNVLLTKINQGKKLLVTYHTLGYPNLQESVDAMKIAIDEGVDVLEIGFPYSDPIADGPIIQMTSSMALENGVTFCDFWTVLNDLTKQRSTPIVLMTYYNVILQYGIDKFVLEAKKFNLAGIILPDLPLDMIPENLFSINPIQLIAPNTTVSRANELVSKTEGFVYVVSQLNTTGSRAHFDPRLDTLLESVELNSPSIPRLLGFGIRNAEDVHAAFQKSIHGVIIGSELLTKLGQGIEFVRTYIRDLRLAVDQNATKVLEV